MKKTLSFILIIFSLLVVLTFGLFFVIPSATPTYASSEETFYYLNAEALFSAVNAGETGINLLTCVDEYENEIYLTVITFAEMGFDSAGICLLFPEEIIVYYASSELAVPEIGVSIPKGYNTENVDTSTGQLIVPFNVISFDERFIQTTPFDYSAGMPEFAEELSDEDTTFIEYITPFVTFVKSLPPITQNIFDLFYYDGAFTAVGLVFIYLAGFGLALLLFNLVIKLWRFNG